MIEYLIIITALYLISLGVMWWSKNKQIKYLESQFNKARNMRIKWYLEACELQIRLDKYKPLRDEKGRFKKKGK